MSTRFGAEALCVKAPGEVAGPEFHQDSSGFLGIHNVSLCGVPHMQETLRPSSWPVKVVQHHLAMTSAGIPTLSLPLSPSGCESLYKGGADSWSFSIRQQRAPKSPSASRPAPVTQPPQRSENMKASVAACAISLLFLLALCCSSTFSAPVGYDVPTSCCLSYTKKKMPLNRVASYYKTNSRCSQPAIVFTTKKGHDVCANPAEPWVRQLVEHLQSN
ncbi:uncharacterized protein LOC128336224 isoform X2 [Hemicordylus capensis]|uniref:uncharacterized protein LOC128336224 isoform X2 n=1 Tax=Hemicordylus capensis TaxID=884348 RepID=UPI0023034D6D|nr:uncharacterized protein LOC128336224 isoform X2 [Hemicordylus capensis]